MSTIGTRTLYLASGEDRVCALYDEPAPAPPGSSQELSSVLLCPLFGNDDLCAYRSRRDWARTLAAAGHPTLRIDLPGTGDSSGGPRDADRLGAWTRAVANAASWLGTQAPANRLTAIGVGLGGLLAWSAAAQGAEIDDLVLWAVPARGRTFMRQLRALARMESSRSGSAPARNEEQGSLPVAGFLLSAETAAALEALDISEHELPRASARRVLLLERDGLEVDERLHAALASSGAELTIANGEGYGAMVAPPQESRPPLQVIDAVEEWLRDAPAPRRTEEARGVRASSPHSTGFLELATDGRRVRERPITIEHPEGTMRGVIAEPRNPAPVCAVLLNAGALRHIGPGRMWVEQARSWAARGVSTLRVDLAGIGDAEGSFDSLREDKGFYVSSYVAQTMAVLDALAAAGMPQRFVLGGLCSGAYWSLHAALKDERVSGVYMLNPRAIIWDAHLQPLRNARKLASIGEWRRFLRGELKPRPIGEMAGSVAVAMHTRMRGARGARALSSSVELENALAELERRDVEVLGVFTFREPLLEELEQDGRLELMMGHRNVRIERLAGPLASHTLEPPTLQRAVHGLLDDAIARQLQGLARSERTLPARRGPVSSRPGAPVIGRTGRR